MCHLSLTKVAPQSNFLPPADTRIYPVIIVADTDDHSICASGGFSCGMYVWIAPECFVRTSSSIIGYLATDISGIREMFKKCPLV